MAKTELRVKLHLLGAQHSGTMQAMSMLAMMQHLNAGGLVKNYAEAEKTWRNLFDVQTQVLGGMHPRTLWTLHGLALSVHGTERREDAIELMRQCFYMQCKMLGRENTETKESLRVLNVWMGRPLLEDHSRE